MRHRIFFTNIKTMAAIFFIAVLLALQVAVPVSADLEAFFLDKLDDFPNWVTDMNLDPTPVDPNAEELSLSKSNLFVKMDTQMSDVVVNGYSKHLWVQSVDAQLEKGEIRFRLSTETPIYAYGSHFTNWSILFSNFSSVGQWRAAFVDITPFCGYMSFEVLPSGYLNVTKTENDCYHIWRPYNTTFDGISDNEAVVGYEQYVESFLQEIVYDFMESVDLPVAKVFEQYWRGVFANTTLQEVINYTPKPGLSTTPSGETYEPTDDPGTYPATNSTDIPPSTYPATNSTDIPPSTYPPTDATDGTSPPGSEIYYHIDQMYYHLRMIEHLIPSRPRP